jgi:CubicO group peptidase (beta-lactamase class C family)
MTVLLLLQALSLGPAIDSLAAAQHFSGVVLIARNGTATAEKAYGMADREAHRPNNIETAFNVGSINKFFTQIAIQQLADQGKISLDSTLGTYWPDYPNAPVRKVTIRQLLEHRSGIGGNIFEPPPSGKRSDLRKLSDFLPLFVNEPMQFDPGTRQQYSNAGYLVLGLLVERLSGESYYDYVRKHIYAPAGMTRTAHYAVDSLPENTAIGYTTSGRNSDLLPGRGSSAGGGYSTAHDLLRLLNALREHKVPSAPGLGFAIAGGAPGLNAIVESDLPGGYDVIVLANLDPRAAETMSRAVRDRLH